MAFRLSFIIVFLSAAGAHAQSDAVRAEFQSAYLTVGSNAPASNPDSDTLKSYILYPYLQALRLRYALANTEDLTNLDGDVETFLKTHDKEVVSFDLRRVWYTSLAKRQEWERLLSSYREVNDPTIQCYALTGRVALQRNDGLQAAVVAAWSNAPESRPACEPAFTWLKAQGALSDALIEKRARIALGAGNPLFARQMTALLPKEISEPLNNWASLIERPRAAIDAAIAAP